MSSLLLELKLACRQILRAPFWTAAVIVTLALAIGVNTATFATFHSVILRALPYPDGEELVLIKDQYRARGFLDLGLSEPEYYEYSRLSRSFEEIAAAATGLDTDALLGDQLHRLSAARVSGDFLSVLGVTPRLGRSFRPEELEPGGSSAVALLSESLFERHLAGDASKVGYASLEIDGTAHQVIGVLPEDFVFPSDLGTGSETDVLLPLVLDPAEPQHRGNPYLYAIGRLADGSTLEDARGEKASIIARMEAENPTHYSEDLGFDILLRPLRDDAIGDMRQALSLVLLMVVLTFFVALSNVVSLILARLTRRRKEIGLRLAIGARVPELVRQLGLEALVLAVLGGVCGLLAGRWAFAILARSGVEHIPRLQDTGLPPEVLAYVLVLTGLAAGFMLLASIFHAARSGSLEKILREESSGTLPPAKLMWGRSALVVGQVALSLCLLSASLLLIQSSRHMHAVELGFDPDDVALVEMVLPAVSYRQGARAGQFYESLLREVRAMPGVESAGVVGKVPLASQPEVWPVKIEGAPRRAGDPPPGIEAQVVSHGYLDALDISILDGEGLDPSTDAQSHHQVLVNETMAERYFPDDASPVGRRLQLLMTPDTPWLTVAGVVEDVRHSGLVDEPKAQIYYHHQQIPELVAGTAYRWMTLAVETGDGASGLQPAIVGAVRQLDSQVTVPPMRTLEGNVARVMAPLRFALWILAAFSVLALVMTLIGLYGLISETVARRSRDLAIRQALGAGRSRVVRLILGETFKLVGAGLVVGAVGAGLLAPVLSHHLYGISGFDIVTLALIALLLCLAALVAGFLPAMRAVSPSLLAEIRET